MVVGRHHGLAYLLILELLVPIVSICYLLLLYIQSVGDFLGEFLLIYNHQLEICLDSLEHRYYFLLLVNLLLKVKLV